MGESHIARSNRVAYEHGAAITPDNDTSFRATDALSVSGAGDLAVVFASGAEETIALGVGTWPVSVTKVKATGTDATGITALYLWDE